VKNRQEADLKPHGRLEADVSERMLPDLATDRLWRLKLAVHRRFT